MKLKIYRLNFGSLIYFLSGVKLHLDNINNKKQANDAAVIWLQRANILKACFSIYQLTEIPFSSLRWLKRKRTEKRAEQQAAREHSRRLVLEERRARRMRDLMCTASESKPFRVTEQLAYRF